jgi:hypothetical protein
MSARGGDEKKTRVYTRCEVCGKIVRPDSDTELPAGWIPIEGPEPSNAPRAVCSEVCADLLRSR